MKVYRFALLDSENGEFMGTEVDAPDPQIDTEFWNKFMQGDCTMVYRGEIVEVDDDN
jgi:hypothetical protein